MSSTIPIRTPPTTIPSGNMSGSHELPPRALSAVNPHILFLLLANALNTLSFNALLLFSEIAPEEERESMKTPSHASLFSKK
jgi:hypothetical protein